MSPFPALPGFYQTLFLHLEPVSTFIPVLMTHIYPGAAWFHYQLIPSDAPVPTFLDPRSTMAIWQLGNCYMLLSMLSSFVFRAVRDALPNNPVAQERILGASLFAMAVADVHEPLNSIVATFVGLPEDLRYSPHLWNSMTHGNITTVIVLLAGRIAWFMGIGRKRYYFGQPKDSTATKSK
ncbi:hypothetical protein K488DRAFT_76642 [Vararia minispora EC-137]|uniref:Uncharacterized protein n=1 Tax=Vararia minispora EC-137 TaxID=1314806 RepID=A0ACB8QUF9_9AGAM|nr:hypothetical protein K488DRAFT_76642 [Vararia minispora EC-137]